ncbi:MAG: exodeoxyribonuclease V subunit alpha, partial [Burkholderiaceae bacterium]|nr:exodeoxyribonuclease V subunit alpha [Burkholderiaceae bacterium]
NPDPLVLFSAALCSHQFGRGHPALELNLVQLSDSEQRERLSLPLDSPETPAEWCLQTWLSDLGDVETWTQRLRSSPLISEAEQREVRPLVLEHGRLYLRRCWDQEHRVAEKIRAYLADTASFRMTPARIEQVRAYLDVLFPTADGQDSETVDWQKVAAALAIQQRFSIISGGPGTGKTTVVSKVLALLQKMAAEDGKTAFIIRLAAPTGKAAARLTESIASNIQTLPKGFSSAGIPKEVTTLHRLLGAQAHSRHFIHNRNHPLPLDVLVIDEASMIDLEMMAAILEAIPPHARLILIGDKDQLSSVEAGAVLGHLCQGARNAYRPHCRDVLAAMTGYPQAKLTGASDSAAQIHEHIVILQKSHRFKAESLIGQLAKGINAGRRRLLNTFESRQNAELQLMSLSDKSDPMWRAVFLNGACQTDDENTGSGYRAYLQKMREFEGHRSHDEAARDAQAKIVLNTFSTFQVLAALRKGPWGVDGLNQYIEGLLGQEGLIQREKRQDWSENNGAGWYAGRPILVTRNDYTLGLMNGDIGITLKFYREENVRPSLRVAFLLADGSIKWVQPSRLHDVETVFAMTVHKSQGSEFDHTVLVLPDQAK